MLKTLEFLVDWRCFKKDDTIIFREGVNLLVGDQGVGKSSVLQAIAASSKARNYPQEVGLAKKIRIVADKTECSGLDFEKHNPRIQSSITTMGHLAAMWASHGQSNNSILRGLAEFSNMVIFMDEPDMALSIRSIVKLAELFRGAATRGCQIIAAVHNPLLIQAFEQVYSLEKREWVGGKEFVASQLDNT